MKSFMQLLNVILETVHEMNTGEEPETRTDLPSAKTLQEEFLYVASIAGIGMFVVNAIDDPRRISMSSVLLLTDYLATVTMVRVPEPLKGALLLANIRGYIGYGNYLSSIFQKPNDLIDQVDVVANAAENISSLFRTTSGL